MQDTRCTFAVPRRIAVRKKIVAFGFCLSFLFLCGLQGSPAMAQAVPPDPDKEAVDPCIKSTCRNAPLRENLTAFDLRSKDLGTKHVRGIFGGFEQGAGIAG